MKTSNRNRTGRLRKTTKPKFNENLYRSVEELELSVRSANCLKNADIHKIYQLVAKTEAEMLKTKNFGRKSLNEIKEVLDRNGAISRHEARRLYACPKRSQRKRSKSIQ